MVFSIVKSNVFRIQYIASYTSLAVSFAQNSTNSTIVIPNFFSKRQLMPKSDAKKNRKTVLYFYILTKSATNFA